MTEPDEVKRFIRNHPWATFVSATSSGLVASHYPLLLDESSYDIAVHSHFGRPDDELHELVQHQILVIVQGRHDSVSPSWYAPGELVPTWNHDTAHLYGTPQLLDAEENYQVLCRLTDHFEAHQPGGRSLLHDETATQRAAKGTTGLRLPVDRFEARAKLSQNKTPDVVSNITEQLAKNNPPLAQEMNRQHASRPPT